MKIFYLKYTVFESSYRCDLVRKRLAKFIETNKPQGIVISGLLPKQIKAFDDFVGQLGFDDLAFIYQPGEYMLEQLQLLISETHMLIGDRLIAPVEGSVAMIQTEPFKVDYIVMDMFADEVFADYHGELEDHHLKELSRILSKKP